MTPNTRDVMDEIDTMRRGLKIPCGFRWHDEVEHVCRARGTHERHKCACHAVGPVKFLC